MKTRTVIMAWLLYWAVLFLVIRVADAETPAERNARVASSLVAAHPDVAAQCDQSCASGYLANSQYLNGLSARVGIGALELARLEMLFNYEWGIQFTRTHGRAPGPDDWVGSWKERQQAFADLFAASPRIWMNRFDRMNRPYDPTAW